MSEPSMDEILAEGARRERRAELWLGLVCIAGGATLTLGMASLASYRLIILPLGVIGFGASRILRWL